MLEWFIAGLYLRSKRKESFISFISWFALIGIMLGVAVLIIVMSVMNGFRSEIIKNFLGFDGHISIRHNTESTINYSNVFESISSSAEIKHMAPVIQQEILINHASASKGALLLGLNKEDIAQRHLLQKSIRYYGNKDPDFNDNIAIIGRVLFSQLNLAFDESVTILLPNGHSTLIGFIPKFGNFRIQGLLNTQLYQYDSALFIIPLQKAQQLLGYGDLEVNKIDLFLHDPNKVSDVKNILAKQLNQDYLIETWQDKNNYLINALTVERNVMFLILSLVILIAAFNIVAGVMMLVKSKIKEIAVLRTIGFSETAIMKIFLIVGLRIGVVGTLLGVILGILIAVNIESIRIFLEKLLSLNLFAEEIYFLSKLPAEIHWVQILSICVMSMIFTVASALYPSFRASSVNPVEGLRHD